MKNNLENTHNLNHATSDLAKVLLLEKGALAETLLESKEYKDHLKNEIEEDLVTGPDLREDIDGEVLDPNQDE